MKFNTTYIPTIKLLDTIKEIEYVKSELIKIIKDDFNLIQIAVPAFLEESDERLISSKGITRGITFDLLDELKIGSCLLSPSNYMRDLFDRLNLKDKEGLIGTGQYIFRDLEETPAGTTIKDEINIQIKFENIENAKEAIDQINKKIYFKIYDLANEMSKKYNIENILEKQPYYVHSQDLENENPNLTSKEQEVSFSLEQNSFFLVNPGKILHSGKRHTYLPPETYDMSNFYQLIIKDKVNTSVIKPIQISILANGIQLSDQLNFYDIEQFKGMKYYNKLITQEFKIIEIRMNIPRLLMALLAKGHISELQPGNISEESKIIKQKYSVEKY